ncbi:MAG: nucleotidyl transferase AbiEii/AbiGii toxin family protein [Oscillospiraceae bacterium]|jgi:predicted nucleotidyltransferase component of viral defense system|nr:nucleotidyl transferase AbiEii/AbiGii toxin family protein [Oscillospiraceae bacterium]
MSKGAMSLKAQIRNLAKKKNVKAQVLLQNFMFERFLERLSLSEYKDEFILKGGMLIAAIVGIDIRSTMDLDATLRSLPLTEESIYQAMTAVCSLQVQDDVTLTAGTATPIRPDDIYGGYRVKITAVYDTIETPFTVDISTGDVITPQPVKYTFRGIFDEDKSIELWAYNIETVLSEKLETILSRATLNTRARDFYDIFILGTTQPYDNAILRDAFAATTAHRGTSEQIVNTAALLKLIEGSSELRQMWEKYRKEFDYARDITYEQVVEALKNVCAEIF